MLAYAMTQELATFLSYRNLRHRLDSHGGDPALARLLTLLAVDEKAHYDFFLQCVQVYLKHDREATLEQLRRVMNNFQMPAIHELAESRKRVAEILELQIMDEDTYYREVYLPILLALNVSRKEMRNRVTLPKSAKLEAT